MKDTYKVTYTTVQLQLLETLYQDCISKGHQKADCFAFHDACAGWCAEGRWMVLNNSQNDHPVIVNLIIDDNGEVTATISKPNDKDEDADDLQIPIDASFGNIRRLMLPL